MSVLNGFMTGLFDILLFPFRAMPALVGLLVFSIVCGIVFLLLFKYTSPQKTIKKIKNRIKAGLYEVRLYKDDLGIIFQANKSLLANNGLYISCCIIPLVPMVILIAPVLFQLDARYGISPLEEGDVTLLKVVLSENVDIRSAEVELEVPEGLTLEAGPVRIPSKREWAYRLKVNKAGHYDLGVSVNGKDYTKSIDAEEDLAKVSPIRIRASLSENAFYYPAEQAWPADALVESIEVKHDRKDMLGISGDYFPWLIIFCVVALAAGFAFKGVFKVTI